ncbi:DUF6438 domain-containing protein [Sphingosinicella rhizophila]|uniref:DUF6438 domain-containing protein n=1 Tax=Sphingosinicella rhizophila TaxID=3050082 RepID=A0ABU3Q8P8_9SPHN|nr:DUF6438 domain-containing protein [Sphingosinicella sp. GR2756]MDT9599783.1 DUF6438 domain-containing protein [Sphingosinicella sp. GR2756]
MTKRKRSVADGRAMLGLAAAALYGAGLAGCATIDGSASPEAAPASITYETGPCFGACPVYRVTVTVDGQGWFEGRRFTAVDGERRFSLSRAQYEAFARHLSPLRPDTGSIRYSGENCTMMATDMPSASVEWKDPGGSVQNLYFYFGCDMEKNRALAERLRAAPELLPIAAFVRPAK